MTVFGCMKMWTCFGFSFGGSTTGTGTGVALTFTIFGAGGGGATGIAITGVAISVMRKFKAVGIFSGYKSGIIKRKIKAAIWMPALRPIRFQLRLGSGSVARRALIGLVPMACFQASRFCGALRFASKPTPSRVTLGGGSAIIVVIPLAASNQPIVIDAGNFAGSSKRSQDRRNAGRAFAERAY